MNPSVKWGLFILFLGLLVGSFELYQFLKTDYAVLKAQETQSHLKLSELKAESQKLGANVKSAESAKQELQQLTTLLEGALIQLPRNENLSALLSQLSQLAENMGLRVSTFSSKVDSSDTDKPSFYETAKIDFSVSGSFSQTLAFLNKMADLKQSVRLDGVKLVPVKVKGGTMRNHSLVRSELSLRTYRFHKMEENVLK